MVSLLSIALVLAGLVFLFAGAALSKYGVALLGMAIGAGMGYLLAPTIGGLVGFEGLGVTVVLVLLGIVLGVALAYLVLSMTIAILSFAVGAFFGRAVLAPAMFDAAWYLDWGVGLLVGIAAAVASVAFTRTVLILLTSAVGAALVSREISTTRLRAAQEGFSIEPLSFELLAPIFFVLFIFGLLTQFGLFKLGYVTALAKRLPGAGVIANRR